MYERILLEITGVIVLGIGAQWLAWWIRVPSILLLLTIGFIAGPVTGLLDPNELLGDMLLPFVSLAVALILYEGGLSLRFRELRGGGIVMWRLVTMGAAVTWALSAVGAIVLLRFSPSIAVLLGAILVVTGPTVIIPLLREIRPSGRIGAILKWEGIVIDPIGAMLAVLVFEAIALGSMQEALPHVVRALIETVLVGAGLGVAAGFLLAILLRIYWIPDFLQNAVSLMMVLGVYTLSQHLRDESGLFAATVMGITLANQRVADVHQIVVFKENLRVLLISSLFILLAARLRMEQLTQVGPMVIAFLIFLIAVVRPLSVLVSTVGSRLPRREVMFLSIVAPRGIVAASVAAVFALRLQDQGYQGSHLLVPATFIVIAGTVLFSAIVAPWSATRLGLAERNPQGTLIIGANAVARAMAKALKGQGFRVLLVDSNRENIMAARSEGLEANEGNILSETIYDALDLAGIGRMIAMTPNAWVNMLATQRFAPTFGRDAVYQVAPEKEGIAEESHHKRHGRLLVGKKLTWREFAGRVNRGAVVKATPITLEFSFEAYRREHGDSAIPLMTVSDSKKISVYVNDQKADPKPGQTLIAIVDVPRSGNGAKAG